ncbi:uncharacterized protein LOC135263900 [Anguilla rostrata]|uniref:uncharacterized protein LOC135263900 n=1 Tax=Anguilla rostrata TaxID=7938 RepID=UPI0030CA8ED7
MAEVGRAFGRTAFTLLKKTNNLLFSRSGEKTTKSAIVAVAVSSGTRTWAPQYMDPQAQGHSCQSVVFSVDDIEKPPVRETKLLSCLPKQVSELIFICQLEGGFFSHGLNVRDLQVNSAPSGFENTLCVISCYQTEFPESLEKHIRPGSSDLSKTEETNKYTEDPGCFYTSLASGNTRVRFVVNLASSVGKQNHFLTAAVLTKSHGTWAQQKRSLSTVMLTERGFLQRSRGEVRSSVRAYMRNNSPDPPPYQSKTAYYDTLQVPTNATHAQIKTAYYKQSFIYHPDKNAGSEEATKRFSEITEAYNVLGNKSLKKKYDRGILSKADVQGAGRPPAKEPPSSSAASQQKRPRQSPAVGMSGKSVFDFDAFYRAHYNEQLQREKDVRHRREEIKKKVDDPNQNFLTEVTVGLLVAMAVAVLVSMKL